MKLTWEDRVRQYESEGMTRSDAQAVVDAEDSKRERKNKARRDHDAAMRDLGLKRVRGGLGGVYWE